MICTRNPFHLFYGVKSCPECLPAIGAINSDSGLIAENRRLKARKAQLENELREVRERNQSQRPSEPTARFIPAARYGGLGWQRPEGK